MNKQQKTTLWILWYAFLAGTAIYPVLGFFFLGSNDPMPDPLMLYILGPLVFAGGALSLLAFRFLIRTPLEKGTLTLDSDAGYAKAQTRLIICWAIAESSAVYGVLLVFFYASPIYAVVSSGWSLFALLLQSPAIVSQRK